MEEKEEIFFYGSLHNHTDYSNLRLRDSINKLPDLIDRAIELGHTVVGITEHETTSNSIKAEKYYRKIKKKNPNFKVVLGNEVYLCRNGLNSSNFIKGIDRYYHFCLYALDGIGHEQIREISTRAWGRSYRTRNTRRVPTYYQDLVDIIKSNPGHVVGSTACLGGALPTQLIRMRDGTDMMLMDKIIRWCEQMENIFGKDNFFLELQPSASKEQTYVNRQLIDLSKKLEIPYIITTDSHYLKKEEAKIHKAYLNSQNGDREVDSFYATTYMMDTEELESHLQLSKEELEYGYTNIKKIADRCEDFTLLKPLKMPQLKWKDNKVFSKQLLEKYFVYMPELRTCYNSSNEGDRSLALQIIAAIEEKKDVQNAAAYEEINACLEMTRVSSEKNNTNWSIYYLNLQKIIEECWKAGTIIGCGRGSGVGFILLYLLDITQINPLLEKTQTMRWRFLNPDRVSVLDVDIDIEGGRRKQVLEHLRKEYGFDRVANVATFGTEKAKSAIQTSCRGLDIDVDTAMYLSAMIVEDRGAQRSLAQTFYGDEEAGFTRNKQFAFEMINNYPEVWELAQRIEGIICRSGEHAGGVIFVDESFTKSTALMRAPNGDIITQFDLHDCEDCSLIKYDLLSVEALDKMHICLDLLVEQGMIEYDSDLKRLYEKNIGIYNIERTNSEMWKMVWEHKIHSLFQMGEQSGIQGISLTLPESVDDLATLNSIIRLMAQEKGGEQPVNKFARFKKDIGLWYKEMDDYGLTLKEQDLLSSMFKISYGICESQEGFMTLVQTPECGGFDLTWADRLRKSIAKKNPEEYNGLEEEYFEEVRRKGLSINLCKYVWNVLVAMSKGYGFNKSHTLAYSLIALQEMNLAFNFPVIFWNCACLVADSGGAEDDEQEEEIYLELEEEDYDDILEDFGLDEDDEDDEDEIKEDKKSKKTKSSDYGKIATAIGKITSSGIIVAPPDINKSTYTFSPDVENNTIRYGLSGITKIGEGLILNILASRPYESLDDLVCKVRLNKPQIVNLIKSGALDCFGNRIEIMEGYIDSISDKKNAINLRNLQMLIKMGLIPNDYAQEVKVFNFNKYLKKLKSGGYYSFDNIALKFFEANYDIDILLPDEVAQSGFKIKEEDWKKLYKKSQDKIRPYVKKNELILKDQVNKNLSMEIRDKYASGSISRWEMEATSYYYHEHELLNMKLKENNLVSFAKLSEQPEIDEILFIKGKQVPLFKINRIAGTVLDKNKKKKTVTLLTNEGVVLVKIFGDVYNYYDKQLSQKDNTTGKKKVIEKSWFARGNKVIVSGIRREDSFLAKKYSRTPWHLVELITSIDDNGEIKTREERMEV